MGSQHYSLRWNNHQNHILNAFDTLLQSETLVDVTLVCEETSVRAHKVVLSACSPYFQRIFSENPCKHPIIVLKDLRGWEVQAIVDFMYKGEISVVQDQLQSLIKAAESLQVRGLTQTENFLGEKDGCGFQANPFAPSPSLSMYRGPGRPFSAPVDKEPLPLSPFSPSSFEPPVKMPSLPHMAHMTFTENPPHPDQRQRESDKDRSSPIPRRKQARPMRRSGEVQGGPQDLSKNANPSAIEAAENLSLKKPFHSNNSFHAINSNNHHHHHHHHNLINNNNFLINNKNNTTNNNNNNNNNNNSNSSSNNSNNNNNNINNYNSNISNNNNNNNNNNHSNSGNTNESRSQPSPPLIPPAHSKPEIQSETEPEVQERDAIDVQTGPEDFLLKSESMALLSGHPSDPALDNANFLPMPSLSALSMTPPHIFSLDQQLGLFPGIETCRNPLIPDIQDHRTENHIISKRKMGRPKGQHSAPRGGPPRSWTNAELTEALQHVWNKKMTTSQASRIFGIPYNSLLMYVRGKYGKSLKLEQLKKDCLGGPGGALDLLGLGSGPGNNNNHPSGKGGAGGGGGGGGGGGSGGDDPNQVQAPRPADHEMPLPPGFNPYAAANFYPDFGPPFPVPVSMIHLLPQSEKNREPFGSAEKARDLFVQGLHLPQDLSSPEAKEDEYRGPRSKSRDNNNGGSVEGSPVNVLKAEPQAHLLENGSEN